MKQTSAIGIKSLFAYISPHLNGLEVKNSHRNDPPMLSPTPLPRGIFWFFTAMIPVVILCLAEMVLRWANYGGNLDLVVTREILGKEYYTLNRGVARRYFSQAGIAVPEASDDLFEVRKGPMTKRIFMLGESTMAGYPFDYNATPSRLLRDRLVQLLPQYNFEVVNVGLAAINSYTVLDFIKELVGYQPDAFVVYCGHNEFYGAMGVGSTEYLGRWRWLVNGYLQLRHVRLFLLVRDGVIHLRNFLATTPVPNDATLMEAMVRRKTIPYGSDDYELGRSTFESNLRSIIDVAHDNRIPIVVGSLASNIRNQPPFISVFSAGTSPSVQATISALMDKARLTADGGRFAEALGECQQAVSLDSLYAAAHFQAARCLDTLGRFIEAKKEYEKSRDLDGLRFRASTEFNGLIRRVCEQDGVPLADVEKAFEDESPHGLVGANLMLEHLHPTFDGYLLLAKTFSRTIIDNDVIVKRAEWKPEYDLSDQEFKKKSDVTEFDLEAARYRIHRLMSGWPFRESSAPAPSYIPLSRAGELAVEYVNKHIAWSQARYDLGDWYAANGRYDSAKKEYLAVFKITPYNYYPLMLMGDMDRLEKNDSSAEREFRQALQLRETPFVHVRLGVMYYEQGKTNQSIDEFQLTLGSEISGTERMDAHSRSLAYYFLGAALGKSGDVASAKANLQLAIQTDPHNEEAKKMLDRINR